MSDSAEQPGTESAGGLSYLEKLTTSELICIPFLDTDTSVIVPEADRLLASRGWSASRIHAARRFAAVGLWWQLVAWEWASLDIWDVLAGYAVISIVVGLALTMVGLVFADTLVTWGVGAAAAGAVMLVASVIGWRARRHSDAPAE